MTKPLDGANQVGAVGAVYRVLVLVLAGAAGVVSSCTAAPAAAAVDGVGLGLAHQDAVYVGLLGLTVGVLGFLLVANHRAKLAARAEVEAIRLAEAAFDPLAFFYQVQQASMDGDRAMLGGICSSGMADVLASSLEPGRRARLTLRGVTYKRVTGGYEFRFFDTVQRAPVVQHWGVRCHLLVEIAAIEG